MPAAQTFKALGDPVRLQIIDRLCNGTAYTLTGVSKDLGLTRQGARKHLQILADAKLISLIPHGRQTTVAFEAKSLNSANAFIAQLEDKWEKRLEALRDSLESDAL